MTDELLALLAGQARQTDGEGECTERSIRALAEVGLLGLTLPRESGGGGAGMRRFAEVTEQIAARCASTAMVYLMHVCGAQAIAAASISAKREEALRKINSGRA